jgi:hypothetical protein
VKFGAWSHPSYPIRFEEFDPVKISPDYATLLKYGDEFYQVHCPRLPYYELDKRAASMNSAGVVPGSDGPDTNLSKASEIAEIWGEQVGGLEFSRQLTVAAYPSYSEGRRHQLTARGLEIEQLIRLSVGLLELQRDDLFPSIGDQFDYLDLRYTVLDVYVRPEDIFIHTGLPLHITLDSVTYRFGDSKNQVIRRIQADPTILRGYVPDSSS